MRKEQKLHFMFENALTLKRLGGQSPPRVFPKMCFLEIGWNPAFLWISMLSEAYYHKLHVSWKFYWYSSYRSENIWRFEDMKIRLLQYEGFLSNFWIFQDLLVAKELMTSGYNRWCQYFFHFQHTLNTLFNNYIKLYRY